MLANRRVLKGPAVLRSNTLGLRSNTVICSKSYAFVSKHLEFAKQGHYVIQFVTSHLQIVDLPHSAYKSFAFVTTCLQTLRVCTQTEGLQAKLCKRSGFDLLAYKSFAFVSKGFIRCVVTKKGCYVTKSYLTDVRV